MSQQNPKSLLPPLILVATHFELQAIKSGLGNCGISADFECIGVGPGAVWRWAELKKSTKANDSPTGRTVILAGFDGSQFELRRHKNQRGKQRFGILLTHYVLKIHREER